MIPTHNGETVIFDQSTNKYIYNGEDNITYEFDEEKKAWFPRLTDEVINAQQAAYKVEGVDESIPVEKPGLKRKREKALKQPKKKPHERKNTSVYVSGLPLNATVEEVSDLFKRGGVFLVDPVTKIPKIKFYLDKDGKPKGEALIIYLREESVSLACQLLDSTEFRYGEKNIISVQPAVFQEKEINDENQEDEQERKLKARAIHQLHKTVVLKHMFTLKELEDDPAEMLDIKQDVREECEKIGTVTSVNLFDMEEDGIVVVRFKTIEEADNCVKKMNGRAFAGRRIEASISSGNEKFKKSSRQNAEEESLREEEYGKWLESQTAN